MRCTWPDRVSVELPPDARPRAAARCAQEIQLAQRELTIVHARATAATSHRSLKSVARELETLATACHGRLEPSSESNVVVSFPRPLDALRFAIRLHRMAADLQPAMALATGHCTLASFWAGSRRHVFAMGGLLERAQDLAQGARAGTLALCANVYAGVRDHVEREVWVSSIVETFEDGHLQQASLTPAPRVRMPLRHRAAAISVVVDASARGKRGTGRPAESVSA
jgi:hypothetical protein